MGFLGGASGEEPTCQCRKHKETQVWSLGQEDPMEEGMAIHSSILENLIDRETWRAYSP